MSSLSAEQEAVRQASIDACSGDILVIAGPGSGKTHTLISTIASLVEHGVKPEKVVAITFTRNAAAEMRVRLLRHTNSERLADVHASTFHSWIGHLSNQFVLPRHHPPITLDTAGLASALQLFNPDPAHPFTKAEVNAAERSLEGCETFRQMRLRNFNRVLAQSGSMERFRNLRIATLGLRRAMRRTNVLTHGTLMRSGLRVAGYLDSGSIEWLCIDEVQDINCTQMRFVEAVQRQTGCRILAIGDDDQGIYKFRGASSVFIEWMRSRRTTKTLALLTNYRATGNIVGLCEAWISPNRLPGSKEGITSSRERENSLPIVLLTSPNLSARAEQARILFEGCCDQGFLSKLGEAGILKYSILGNHPDIRAVACRTMDKAPLEKCVLNQMINILENTRGADWLATAWPKMVEATKTQRTIDFDITRIGAPGLAALLSALQALCKLRPGLAAADAANILRTAVQEQSLLFEGNRRDPDYEGDEANFLSLHGSKGLEFRAIFLPSPGAGFKVKTWQSTEGLPCLPVAPNMDSAALEAESQRALAAENRRLLYVGFSRAADFLIISGPRHLNPSNEWEVAANAFAEELEKALCSSSRCEICEIASTAQAGDFVSKYFSDNGATFRHPTWSPPVAHRTESFTSLQRRMNGIERDPETQLIIPEGAECPRLQSPEARIGDEFHRLMHLLCRRPELVEHRLKGCITTNHLIAQILASECGQEEKLRFLIDNYFSDEINKPWEWLRKARAEVPFSLLVDDPAFEPDEDGGSGDEPEKILLEGFIDLVQYDAHGLPLRLVEYKTGSVPDEGSEAMKRYQEQVRFYRAALQRVGGQEPVPASIYFPHAKFNCVL